MKQTHKTRSNQKGVALLTALFTVMIISYLAVEIGYEVGIEYRLSRNRYEELKAHYAAKSGMELSLLRISIYKQVVSQFGDQIQDPKLLDMIWNFPFSWPPSVSEDASLSTKEEINAITRDTMQDTQWATQIQSEGVKIDINDLYSPVESLRKAVADKIIMLLSNRINGEDAWAERNRNLNPEEIVHNLIDWIDPDSESLNGGAESRYYADVIPTDTELRLPPNQDFKTVEELHMVAGITDDVFEVIAPQLTVYGVKGINVNYADKDMLKAIDFQITDEVADQIIQRRQDPDEGPFRDLEDFTNFLSSTGVDINTFNESNLPLRFKKEYNFKIISTGLFGNRTKEITAIVYDFANAKSEITKLLEEEIKNEEEANEEARPQPPPPAAGTGRNEDDDNTNSNNQDKQPTYDKGRPRILYWHES